ncbi:MAG: hypothetical protein F2754_01860 [Actinobacteria bacterium]|uniref:Unannotated protein n=1 Tax=freshwater metagenome TaxID=449393 RepID=A0A6J6V1E0_9ZZZZ|nr:hypothetical protein [Actinomycetota bacterium]MSW91259.1 hypothetical protein [Actinomycetota bacterium]MSX86116.1 hypothetical protein [Actinomycetota bacterium]MSY72974.1 hypothetical protein [Actinomycetota bacterium]
MTASFDGTYPEALFLRALLVLCLRALLALSFGRSSRCAFAPAKSGIETSGSQFPMSATSAALAVDAILAIAPPTGMCGRHSSAINRNASKVTRIVSRSE